MLATPQSNRKQITIFGQTNSGKSSLFNELLGQDVSIVSEVKGTTTDPVSKGMELLPYGPVTFVDTAGLNDNTELGEKRMKKTADMLKRTDVAVYVIDVGSFNRTEFEEMKTKFAKGNIPLIVALSKADLYDEKIISDIDFGAKTVKYAIGNQASITEIKKAIMEALGTDEKEYLIGDLVNEGGTIVLVTPIDSEAPKGRLILPQAQVIRDCLDNNIIVIVVTEKNLPKVIHETKNIDLVITDSQVFKTVAEIVPRNIKLTSFSIIMARQKGSLTELLKGAKKIKNLKDGSKVLIAENCTHNRTHEDIGTVKIPAAIKKLTGCNIEFEYAHGKDFPDVAKYDLVVHCGGCMVTKKEMCSRIQLAEDVGITNYGIVLSLAAGILDRSIEIFEGIDYEV